MSPLSLDRLLRSALFTRAPHQDRVKMVHDLLDSCTPDAEQATEYPGCSVTQETRLREMRVSPPLAIANEVDIVGWSNNGDVIVDWYCDVFDGWQGNTYVLIYRDPDEFGKVRELGLGHGPSTDVANPGIDPGHWPNSVRKHVAFLEILEGNTPGMTIETITMTLDSSQWRGAFALPPLQTPYNTDDAFQQILAELKQRRTMLFERDFDALTGPIELGQEIPGKPGKPVTAAWLTGLLGGALTGELRFRVVITLYARVADGPYDEATLTVEGSYPTEQVGGDVIDGA